MKVFRLERMESYIDKKQEKEKEKRKRNYEARVEGI